MNISKRLVLDALKWITIHGGVANSTGEKTGHHVQIDDKSGEIIKGLGVTGQGKTLKQFFTEQKEKTKWYQKQHAEKQTEQTETTPTQTQPTQTQPTETPQIENAQTPTETQPKTIEDIQNEVKNNGGNFEKIATLFNKDMIPSVRGTNLLENEIMKYARSLIEPSRYQKLKETPYINNATEEKINKAIENLNHAMAEERKAIQERNKEIEKEKKRKERNKQKRLNGEYAKETNQLSKEQRNELQEKLTNNKDIERYYLNLPFRMKDGAKMLGAKWDPDNKKWYFNKGMGSVLDAYKPYLLAESDQIKLNEPLKKNDAPKDLNNEPLNKDNQRQYLDIGYSMKEFAKENGAEWDQYNKKWYFDNRDGDINQALKNYLLDNKTQNELNKNVFTEMSPTNQLKNDLLNEKQQVKDKLKNMSLDFDIIDAGEILSFDIPNIGRIDIDNTDKNSTRRITFSYIPTKQQREKLFNLGYKTKDFLTYIGRPDDFTATWKKALLELVGKEQYTQLLNIQQARFPEVWFMPYADNVKK